jgi:hypothetical protein
MFLSMNTWMFETCRRHYNYNINVKSVHFVGSYYVCMYVCHNARYKKKRKIKIQSLPHRQHATSLLQTQSGSCYLRKYP